MMLEIIKLLLTNCHGIYATTGVKPEDKTSSLTPTSCCHLDSKIFNYFDFCNYLNKFLREIRKTNDQSICPSGTNQESNTSQEMKVSYLFELEFITLIQDIIQAKDDIKNKMKLVYFEKVMEIMKTLGITTDAFYNPVDGFCPVTYFMRILSEVSSFESNSDFEDLVYMYLPEMLRWDHGQSSERYSNYENEFFLILNEWVEIFDEEESVFIEISGSLDKKKLLNCSDKLKKTASNLKELFDKLPLKELEESCKKLYEHHQFFQKCLDLRSYLLDSEKIRNSFGRDTILDKQFDGLLEQLDFDNVESSVISSLFEKFNVMLSTGNTKSRIKLYECLFILKRYVMNIGSKENGILNTINYYYEECINEIDKRIKYCEGLDTNKKVEKDENYDNPEEMEIFS